MLSGKIDILTQNFADFDKLDGDDKLMKKMTMDYKRQYGDLLDGFVND